MGFGFTEGHEVVKAHQLVGGLLHQVKVDWFEPRCRIACTGRKSTTWVGRDAVDVVAAQGGETRIEGVGDLRAGVNTDVDGQQLGQAPDQFGGIAINAALAQCGTGGVEVRDLAAGMHARVGAPGHGELHWVAQDHGQLLLDGLLHRAKAVLLTGPPVEVGAVIGQVQSQANAFTHGG